MFKNYGILPGTLSRENPFILFKMLDGFEKDEANQIQSDEYLKIFYGE